MLNHFSKNVFKQVVGIIRYNYKAILWFIFIGSMAFVLNKVFAVSNAWLPVIPVTILGGALAIFIAFKNNSAYDRWWEARKIWGAIVNSSRMFGTEIMTLITLRHTSESIGDVELKALRKRMVYRHLAWINMLRMSLREKVDLESIEPLLEADEYEEMLLSPNKNTFLTHRQGLELEYAMSMGYVEDFRHMAMIELVKDFYVQQGQCERIKKTVFPFYYTYFTRVFLWLFIVILPFALVNTMNYMSVPLSVAISFVFYILDKLGNITEDPFENRAADIPMTAICKNIERDMRFQLGEKDLPEVELPRYSKFKVEFLQ